MIRAESRETNRTKVLFLAIEDYAFWNHRLWIARALKARNVEVVVMTHVGTLAEAIESEGFRLIPWSLNRRNINPLRELPAFIQVCRAYLDERPNLVYRVSLKAILHGGFASRLCHRVPSVNAVAGLGQSFSSATLTLKFLRKVLARLLRFALYEPRSIVVFENSGDRDFFVRTRIVPERRTALIRGAGVDTDCFVPRPEPPNPPLVMLASRMLWEKGVADFVAAARLLKERGVVARFVLVGPRDEGNRGSIPEVQLREWHQNGDVEWWGPRSDMVDVLSQAHIVSLPTFYGEGLPVVLLEAAACGRPIVATNIAGCRDLVRDGHNGLLVPPKDPASLAAALERLIKNPDIRKAMGSRGRQIVLNEFSKEIVLDQLIEVYGSLLGNDWSCGVVPTQADPLRIERDTETVGRDAH